MGNDMRSEFEEYVKKLTTAICKDILLEKMEELYGKYEKEYQILENSTQNIMDVGKALQQETKMVDTKMKEISSNTQVTLDSISADIVAMETSNKSMFDEMRKLNNDNKKQFITDLSNCIEQYKEDLEFTFKQENLQISEKLVGIITREDLQNFADTIEVNTRKSQELVSFINNTYEREIEDNIRKIIENTQKAQETMNSEISIYIKKVLRDLDSATVSTENKVSQYAQTYAELLDEKMTMIQDKLSKLMDEEKQQRDSYLQKQIKLVEQIEPSDEKIQQLTDQVTRLEHIVAKMWKVNMENQKILQESIRDCLNEQKEIERRKADNLHLIDQKAENISWRIYMAFSNSVIMCLFAIMVILLKPWEIWGRKYTIIIAVIFATIVLLMVFLRQIIAKAIAKHKAKKYAKKFSE